MDIIGRCAPKISVDITPSLCLSYGCIVGNRGNEPLAALPPGALPHSLPSAPKDTTTHQGEPPMALFKIRFQIFTTLPPDEILHSTHTVQAGTIADAYLKIVATLRSMAPVEKNPDA